MAVTSVSESNFSSSVMKSGKPVMVDFWAPWCGPCRMVAPVLEELEKEMGERIKFVKVNIDENPRLASLFQVQSIPTLKLFKDGRAVATFVGFQPKQQLKRQIERVI
ncbi:thioredoxin [Paenibacillus sp. HJL G12]|uniref:Thioredoxin n=1 Tax=Paenibacillus dendrobii TaxID=2691084 RepID=A0A7X3LFJ3_9BACL|nr:thioredoxin [Paenibacillus dendrobii]MWV43057.1 thioredoxin [Paenibacillus dendrobii]